MDQLAEKYLNVSPYAYAFNNPIKFVDPTGMAPEPPIYKERSWMGGKSQIKFFYDKYNFVSLPIAFGADDPGNFYQGYNGYILANDMKTKLDVFKPVNIYSKYYEKFVPLKESDGITNCYGDILTNGEFIVMGSGQEVEKFLQADGYKSIPISSEFQVGDIMMDNDKGHVMQAIGKYESGKNKGKMMWRSFWATDKPVTGTLAEIVDYNQRVNGGDSRSQHNSSNTQLFRPTQGDIVNENGHVTLEPKTTQTSYSYEPL